MRLFTNLPKANDLVILKQSAQTSLVGEGDHQYIRPEYIEMVAQSRIHCQLPFRVTRTELDAEQPYLVLEYEWIKLNGDKEWVQIDVPISDVLEVNGRPVSYIEVPKNFDVQLSDSFPPISLN